MPPADPDDLLSRAPFRDGESERLARLFEQAPAMMCTLVGPDHVFEVVNRCCADFFGRELRGRAVAEVVPELVGQGFTALLDGVIATGTPATGTAVPVAIERTPGAPPEERYVDFVYQPMARPDGTPGVFVHGIDVTERVLASRERERLLTHLEQERTRLDALIEQVPLGIVLTDAAGRPQRVNRVAEEYLGSGAEDLRRSGSAEGLVGYHPDGRRLAPHEWPIPRALEGQVTSGQLVRYPFRGEPDTWLRITAGPIRDASGAIVSAVAVVDDITADRAAEDALRTSEERFRAVQEATPDGFMLLKPVRDAAGTVVDFRLTYANPAAARTRGRPPTELAGVRLLDETPGLRSHGLLDAYVRVLETGAPFERELEYRADGTDGYYRVAAVRVGDAIGVTFSDRTAQHLAEERVRHSEARLTALLEHAVDLVVVCDADGTVRYASPSARRAHGDMLGRSAFDHIHPEDRPHAEAVVARVVSEGGASDPAVFRLRQLDGRWLTTRIVARNLLDDPAVRGIVVTGHDVSEARRIEAQLRQAQKLEAVGRLAGGVAHDFNNLLTVINAYAAMLREELPLGDPRRDDAVAIAEAGDRAAALTRQLLAFSRQQVLEPRVVDANEAVRGVERMLRRLIGEDIELTLDLDPAVGGIVVDPGQLEQTLTNLVVNARDAMPRGGRITISTALRSGAMAEGTRRRPDAATAYVAIAVRDEGMGIAPELLPHVFDPFFTTKEAGRGTGLGLATVYGIAEQSGGWVDVETAVGKGATFTLYFPLGDRDGAPEAPDRTPVESARRSECVLVVEDEAAVRDIVRRMLTGAGYRVTEASDGAEALRLARDATARIDLVVTDAVMPEMGGVDLLREVRLLRPSLPAILMTGYVDEDVIRSGELDSGTRLLQKPFSAERLLRAVQEALDVQDEGERRTPAGPPPTESRG